MEKLQKIFYSFRLPNNYGVLFWISYYEVHKRVLGLKRLLYIDKPVVANIGNVITHNVDAVITRWDYFISQFKVIIHYITIFYGLQYKC